MAAAPQPQRAPIFALATAGYGAVLGSLFPVVAVMTIADISGGLGIPADSAALEIREASHSDDPV